MLLIACLSLLSAKRLFIVDSSSLGPETSRSYIARAVFRLSETASVSCLVSLGYARRWAGCRPFIVSYFTLVLHIHVSWKEFVLIRLLVALSLIAASAFWFPAFALEASNPGSPQEDIAGVFSQAGNVSGRASMGDGQETIDTFSGMLQYHYTDAVIPGDGGFDLPIIRRYASKQFLDEDSTNRVFGSLWGIHFGRIKSVHQNANLSMNYCPDAGFAAIYNDDRRNAVFQAPDGSSHTMYATKVGYEGGADATTKARHRITCNNAEGALVVETPAGMKYYFGKQSYFKQGNGLQWANNYIGADFRVEHDNYLYATRIEDSNGNAFSIEYSLKYNADGQFNSPVFTLDRITQGNREVATFNYAAAPGAPTRNVNVTPNQVLHSIDVGRRSISYEYERVYPTGISLRHNLTAVSITTGATRGDGSVSWEYDYYPPIALMDGLLFENANTDNLKSATNRQGGITQYEYEWIESTNQEPLSGIRAVKTKTSVGLGTWEFEYDGGAVGDGFNRTTVSGPENTVIEYKHCNLSFVDESCYGAAGYLFGRDTYKAGSSTPVESETYLWIPAGDLLTNQTQRYSRFGGFTVNRQFSVYHMILLHKTVQRGNVYLSTTVVDTDRFGNPTESVERRSSSFVPYSIGTAMSNSETTRITRRTLENKTGTDLWMLGLPKTVELIDTPIIVSEPALDTDQKVEYTYTREGNVRTYSQYGAVTTYSYDDKGNVTLIVDPNGNSEKMEDYVLGIPQTLSRSFTLAGPAQLYLTRVVDRRTGLVTSETQYRDIATEESYTTALEYDRLGRIEKVISARADDLDIEVAYFARRNETTRGSTTNVVENDAFGRIVKTTSSGSDNLNYVVDSGYDAYGRLTFKTSPYKTGERPYAATYEYDVLGRMLSETDNVDNLSTTYRYPSALTTQVSDRKGQTTTLTYRAFSSFSDTQLMKIDQTVANGENSVTTLIRAKRGRLAVCNAEWNNPGL